MASTNRDQKELAGLLKVLSDPTRLRIFDTLMQGVQCNCHLGDRLNLPMNLISHHLRVLYQAGLVQSERDPVDARWVYYSVDEEALEALRSELMAFPGPGTHSAAPPHLRPQHGCRSGRRTGSSAIKVMAEELNSPCTEEIARLRSVHRLRLAGQMRRDRL